MHPSWRLVGHQSSLSTRMLVTSLVVRTQFDSNFESFSRQTLLYLYISLKEIWHAALSGDRSLKVNLDNKTRCIYPNLLVHIMAPKHLLQSCFIIYYCIVIVEGCCGDCGCNTPALNCKQFLLRKLFGVFSRFHCSLESESPLMASRSARESRTPLWTGEMPVDSSIQEFLLSWGIQFDWCCYNKSVRLWTNSELTVPFTISHFDFTAWIARLQAVHIAWL